MEEIKNLKELTKRISNNLLETISVLDILEEIIDGKRQESFLVSSMQDRIYNAFNDIEECRKLIANPD